MATDNKPRQEVAIDKRLVREKRAQLERARQELKKHFIGIDRIIDELIDAVLVWYVAPELLTRPVIVNLWGMTGVGKTDLVRRLVAALDISDRFVEIELSNGDSTTWHSSVVARLSEFGDFEAQPMLMLFDEIQRFNTIDDQGHPVANTKFSDFWELLSDGRLSRRESPDVQFLVASLAYRAAETDRLKASGKAESVETIGIWEAQNLKRTFRLEEDLEQLSKLTPKQALSMAKASRDSKQVYEPIDCSRSLVIISGNLDEAFRMSQDGAEADLDADVFAAYADKVTVVDVKSALLRRFKPEQVARFGNTHLIYTSLRHKDFVALIDREVERVCELMANRVGVEVEVDQSVHDLIYRNGVFPVQGVRPVFSSVADILETNLAKIVFTALLDDVYKARLRYDVPGKALIARVGETEIIFPYTGRLDKIRQGSHPDKVVNVAVHESGHAVAYGVLFGLAPLHLTARVSSTYVAGFTSPHPIYDTSASMLNQVKVALAGGLAEEIIFGAPQASVGRESDRDRATRLIIDFVRKHGFDRDFQAHYMLPQEYSMDRTVPEADIEKMITRLVAETRHLLIEHRSALVDLAQNLAKHGHLDAEAVSIVLGSHGIEAEVRTEGHLWLPKYSEMLKNAAQTGKPPSNPAS